MLTATVAGLALPERLAAQTEHAVLAGSVRPGDILRIRIWPDSTLGGDFPVEESGLVYLPVLGEVHVAYEEIGALRTRLREAYQSQMRSPVVTVTPLFRVSVLGEVRRPGLYQVEPTMGLFDVISQAGGFTELANEDQMRVVRASGEVLAVDAERALQTGQQIEGVDIRSGDRIVVPRSKQVTTQTVFLVIQSVALLANLLLR